MLSEAGLTVNAVALALRLPANRIGGIVKGQRGITDTSLRLARYFGTSAQMWMNLQAKYDLAIAEDAAVNTELRVAWRRALDLALAKKPGEIVPYKLLPDVVASVKEVALARMQLFSGRIFRSEKPRPSLAVGS